jgi:hypothetical protein
MRRVLPVSMIAAGLFLGLGCGASGTATNSGGPKTTLSPPPGPFNDTVTVTLTTDIPADIFVTTDQTDPHVGSLSRISGPSPLTLNLTRTTTLTYFSRTSKGNEEVVQTADYTRAGGKKGTVTGTIVVGSVAANTSINLQNDRMGVQTFQPLMKEGVIPFEIDGVTSGTHQLLAIADRNGDGQFTPIIDYSSDTVDIFIDLADPFHASAEGVTIYLGASPSGLCTIEGTIQVPKADNGQDVGITALSPSVFTGAMAGGTAAQGLLQQLQHAYNVFASPNSMAYPYAITNLQPGAYLPVPILTAVSQNGLSLNFLVNALHIYNLAPGDVAHADFSFGSVNVSGTVTLNPATPPSGLTYGFVAIKNLSITSTSEAVLMPIFFRPGTMAGTLEGNYLGAGLRDSGQFDIRVFTSLDAPATGGMGTTGAGGLANATGPIVAALTWVINPLSAQPAQASFNSQGMDVTEDINVK